MIVRVISLRIKPESIDDFKTASVANHLGSLKEPGILRFDVLQNEAKPEEFLLYEVYESQEATLTHKETVHYQKWKAKIDPMMAEPRTSTSYSLVAPESEYY